MKMKQALDMYKKPFGFYLKRDWRLILLNLPSFVYLIIFSYIPMAGILIAFQNYQIRRGYFNSPWVGFAHFQNFFSSIYFLRLVRNTILISVYELIAMTIAAIFMAIIINEVKDGPYKRVVQSLSYFPHFISVMIMVGIMQMILNPQYGIINQVIKFFGNEPIRFFSSNEWYRTLFVGSTIWQQMGWSSILYLGAISAIDPQLYEAAKIDGCSRLRSILYITIPALMPILTIRLLLDISSIMGVSVQKTLMMYNQSTYEVADVISSYVYRRGIGAMEFSFGTAVGLFNGVVNLVLVLFFNWIAKKFTEESLF